MTTRGADDPELEVAVRDELDDRLRVVHLERDAHAGMRNLELAEELRDDDSSRACGGAERQRAGELSLCLGDDLVEELLLEREEALRAPVQPPAGLGRLDPAPRAVEERHAEALLERAYLERDGGLRDAETLRGLRERATLDDLAECGKLTRIHKRTLSDSLRPLGMRVWIDLTNSPHVVFFLPLVALLRDRGADVELTARAFAQTLELLEDAGLEHEVVGPPHGGAGAVGKARAMASRLPELRRFAKRRGFDVAMSHASHELPLAARSLGIPSSYAFDYEFARVQHGLGCRAATRVVVPDVIPQRRLDRLGARRRKVARFAGLKEEYALAGFTPDAAVGPSLG